MASVAYTKLFSVDFLHTFYNDKRLQGLRIVPAKETIEQLNHSAMLFKATENGFQVFIDKAVDVKELSAQNNFSLVFSFNPTDPHFGNISEISDLKKGGAYYFSNKHSSGLKKSLTQTDWVTNTDLIDQRSKTFEGLFQEQPFGIIEIFIDGLTENAMAYEIGFKARETYWKYFIVNKSNTEKSTYEILDEGGNLFTNNGSVTLPDGHTATMYVSKQPIPLAEVPANYFKLVSRSGTDDGSDKVLIGRLPVADGGNIKADNDSGVMYSEIFVYV